MVTVRDATSLTGRWGPRASYLQDALLICFSGMFFYVQAVNVVSGRLTSIPFAIEQALLVAIFLTRRRSIMTSTRPWDWIVAAGGWLSIAARPAEAPASWADEMGLTIQMAGLICTGITFIYLGRSFGVVAANRGLKVNGPYRFVRHPIYLSHTITTTGFVLANFSGWNVAILVAVTVFQLLRMRAEERLLTASGAYAEYAHQVRWRLVPGLY